MHSASLRLGLPRVMGRFDGKTSRAIEARDVQDFNDPISDQAQGGAQVSCLVLVPERLLLPE
ncbi:MAG: hypothetical protein IPQ01_02325 [Zoogloea sp.]|nr:hypothetical protein [Zoogloea sp.]